MSKKYRYIRLENISDLEGWDLVEILPRDSTMRCDMCVMCYDDTPTLKDAEIEKLHETISKLEEEKNETIAGFLEMSKKMQNEVLKDFAEIIIDAHPTTEYFVKCLLKEMTEESNGE